MPLTDFHEFFAATSYSSSHFLKVPAFYLYVVWRYEADRIHKLIKLATSDQWRLCGRELRESLEAIMEVHGIRQREIMIG